MSDHNIVYIPPNDTNDWSCISQDTPVYSKELIYTGKFRQGNGVEFEVDETTLNHWARTFNRMVDNGIQVPVPVQHTEDPEATRGHVIGLTVEKNLRGIPALFGRIQFRDEEAAKLAKTAQVSIFSPPEFVDGKGNHYVRPIKHVALTDYPVIPSLQGFESIAASFVVSSNKEAHMPLKKLAERLQITCENDEQLEQTIVASFEANVAKLSEQDGIIAVKDQEIAALKAKVPQDPLTVTAAHRSMLSDNRSMKLDRLVQAGFISPAVKDELVQIFCSEDALTLALAYEDRKDGFDSIVAALAKNSPLPLGEAHRQALDRNGAASNPLLEDAKRRKEALKS